jgi:hypothetical protein
MTRATIGLPHTGIIGLGMYSVKGEARVPRPPAKITTFTGGPTLLEQQEARISRKTGIARGIACSACPALSDGAEAIVILPSVGFSADLEARLILDGAAE